jgi:hypothetical protein
MLSCWSRKGCFVCVALSVCLERRSRTSDQETRDSQRTPFVQRSSLTIGRFSQSGRCSDRISVGAPVMCNPTAQRLRSFDQASKTHRPPTIVRSTGIPMSDDGWTRVGSAPSTTRSANLPGSMDPFSTSKKGLELRPTYGCVGRGHRRLRCSAQCENGHLAGVARAEGAQIRVA